MSEPTPDIFGPYEVPGIGTVTAHDGDTYVVLTLAGATHGYRAPGGTPSEETAAADIAHAIANPPAFPAPSDAAIYAAQLAPGYVDLPTGIRLKTEERAQAKFGRMVTLLGLAIDAGALTPESPVTIFDYADASHEISVTAFRALMLRYGLHCKSLFDQFSP